ncbi:ATP-binding domain-containing protein [Serratia marcescens]|nr:ATP-binding domain-containing protein [Serratia marcescens]
MNQAVRILTIHKSKGLEFDSVVIMAVENETFFGKEEENRCAFFVGVSRAKRRLILTHTNKRDEPANAKHWKVLRTARLEYFDYVLPFVR